MLAIIGGSGLYEMQGVEDGQWLSVDTPFGNPSDDIFCCRYSGQKLAFLPRHGRGHVLSPSEINYRANIYALKCLGVTDILSVSACGSFRDDLPPGDFVLVDQFIDRTYAREKSFFGSGLVAHVALGHPVCGGLGKIASVAADEQGITLHETGTYLAMEGPQFSTKAESHLYRSWGCDVIGMTNMPEAKLAREAEICYASIAMVTDYDCWHEDHEHVNVSQILQVLRSNAVKAEKLIKAMVPHYANSQRHPCPQGCDHALETALVTAVEKRDPVKVAMLHPLLKRLESRVTEEQ
ncbi:MAG: S-methyl-5'-thioadenosine phosphorylase [Kordiimonas sp.]|nr:S-methyl-5'-thioadenosine phosphorylase [Kordiimonas sp.]